MHQRTIAVLVIILAVLIAIAVAVMVAQPDSVEQAPGKNTEQIV